MKLELCASEVRKAAAEAEVAEIELAVARDKEADRLANAGKNRHLSVWDAIRGGNIDAWVSALEHWERRDPTAPVTISINSPGGSVLDGFAIYDTIQRLRRKGAPITTRATGMAGSMAGILFQAGDERVIDKNAMLMIHEISVDNISGSLAEIDDAKTFMKNLNDRLLGILAERSTLTARQISRKVQKNDWWLNAEDAVKYGFADRVE